MSELSHDRYEELLAPLTLELSSMARWVQETGQRLLVLVEGRDAAGKGVAIHAIARTLNPRQCRTVALAVPTERERGQWYFQRYVPHLPARGEIVLFDRSWYNRAGVERVMNFCAEDEAEDFLRFVPEFEQHLVDHGILLFKYWLACDQEQQERRFQERHDNPIKRWKLSQVDLAARRLYDEYTKARDAMLRATHTPHAPWTIVDFSDQSVGRLTLIRDLLDRLPDTELPIPDIPWPPLAKPPRKEKYGFLKPIPPYQEAITAHPLAAPCPAAVKQPHTRHHRRTGRRGARP
ncbi:MAG TPA: polyphosphate kinase 2 [Sphingomicrobium sp.]|nr:polyphosphate kinase 2 [Sphingomicrobium sp.]